MSSTIIKKISKRLTIPVNGIKNLLCFYYYSCYFEPMWLFCLFLLPLTFILKNTMSVCLQTNDKKGSGFVFLLGLIIGSFYSIAIMLLFSDNPYIRDSLTHVFIQQMIFITLPPVILIFLIIILLSKNSFSVKAMLFPDMLTGFYSVYLPFIILSYNKVFTFYSLFAFPIIILIMIITIENSIMALINGPSKSMHPVLYVLASVFLLTALCIPSLLQTFWLLGVPLLYSILVFTLSVVENTVFYILTKRNT